MMQFSELETIKDIYMCSNFKKIIWLNYDFKLILRIIDCHILCYIVDYEKKEL